MPLSAFEMKIFLVLDKCFKTLNSDTFKFSDGLLPLEKISYEEKAASSNLALIKDKSSLHKFSCCMSRNSNSEYLNIKKTSSIISKNLTCGKLD